VFIQFKVIFTMNTYYLTAKNYYNSIIEIEGSSSVIETLYKSSNVSITPPTLGAIENGNRNVDSIISFVHYIQLCIDIDIGIKSCNDQQQQIENIEWENAIMYLCEVSTMNEVEQLPPPPTEEKRGDEVRMKNNRGGRTSAGDEAGAKRQQKHYSAFLQN